VPLPPGVAPGLLSFMDSLLCVRARRLLARRECCTRKRSAHIY